MKTKAAIIEVKGKKLARIPSGGEGCGCKHLFNKKNPSFEFADPKQINPQVGQWIEIELSTNKTLLVLFFLFFFPLCLTLLFSFILGSKTEQWSFATLIGILLLLPYYGLAFLTKKWYSPLLRPVVLNIIAEEEGLPCKVCSGCFHQE